VTPPLTPDFRRIHPLAWRMLLTIDAKMTALDAFNAAKAAGADKYNVLEPARRTWERAEAEWEQACRAYIDGGHRTYSDPDPTAPVLLGGEPPGPELGWRWRAEDGSEGIVAFLGTPDGRSWFNVVGLASLIEVRDATERVLWRRE